MERTPSAFIITERHYHIIIKQAIDNLPQESGGFLGGKDGKILAILPTFNKHLYNKTDTFGITSEDIQRAYTFFAENKLEYYGVYHTHPNGIAEPSDADIRTGQRYHFIIGLSNPENPEFAAFEVFGKRVERVQIQVKNNKGVSVIDLKSNQTHLSEGDFHHEAAHLHNLIENIKKDRKDYPRLSPRKGSPSDFSTLA